MADDLGDTDELSLEELQAQVAKHLPDREAMSLISIDPVADPLVPAEGGEDEQEQNPLPEGPPREPPPKG